eukprot:1607505-Amphidinium_carterae.2
MQPVPVPGNVFIHAQTPVVHSDHHHQQYLEQRGEVSSIASRSSTNCLPQTQGCDRFNFMAHSSHCRTDTKSLQGIALAQTSPKSTMDGRSLHEA